MENITSQDNEKIKILRKLNSVKYRKKYKRFTVENAVIIKDALIAGINYQQLFITPSFIDKNEEMYKKIIGPGEANVFLIDERINKYFSSLDMPSGIGAVYEIKDKNFKISDQIVYLNNISDPGNLGAIFRNALAFGFKNIVLDHQCVDVYNSKVIQAAKDSIFKLNICIDKDREIISVIKNNMEIYSTSLKGQDSILDLKNKNKFCLVFGNEAHGIDNDILELSDKLVKINISKNIESLNVASTAAIIFYELSKN